MRPILRLIGACFFAIAALLGFDSGPVHAQRVPGPAGPTQSALTCFASSPSSTTSCLNSNQVAGRLAATQLQLSFGVVEFVLENVRDRLQGTSARSSGRALISGYAASNLDDEPLGYVDPAEAAPTPLRCGGPAGTGRSWPKRYGAKGSPIGNVERRRRRLDYEPFCTTYSGLGGVDGTWQNLFGGDALVVGIVGSWTGSRVVYDGSPTTVRLEGPGIGLYGTYVNGGFSDCSGIGET